MTRRLVGALCAAVLLLVAAGCSGGRGGDTGYLTSSSVVEVAAGERAAPVELEGTGLEGEELTLADLRGKPAVVVVWGAWCPPCRKEIPDLISIDEEYGDRIGFLGINVRDASPESAQAFVRSKGIPYPSIYSPDGVALLAFKDSVRLGPNSVPALVVLDAEGRAASAILGPLPSRTTLTTLIDDVLAEADKPAQSGG